MFGFPQATGQDAENAVRAALQIANDVPSIRVTTPGGRDIQFNVRVGIATGLVVVGDVVGKDVSEQEAIVGETPNVAARLQSLAESNQVVVCARTRGLLGELFQTEYLGRHDLKGLTGKTKVWRVLPTSEPINRFDALHKGSITPFVNREEELALLTDAWKQVESGHGAQVIFLTGEPGMGKSRLVRRFRRQILSDTSDRISYQCAAQYASTALHPVVHQLENSAKFETTDDEPAKLAKLMTYVSEWSNDLNLVTVLAGLLGITGVSVGMELQSASQKRERVLRALVTHVVGRAKNAPLLVEVEDIHWIDPSTEQFLQGLIAGLGRTRMLVLLTSRFPQSPQWSQSATTRTVKLSRLSDGHTAKLAQSVRGTHELEPGALAQIINRTDGLPLFVEEFTRALIDGEESFEASVPQTLQAHLMARIDRVGQAKEAAQYGALLGREFSYELFSSVVDWTEQRVQMDLKTLVEADVLRQRGRNPDSIYVFTHSLVQEAAAQLLLKSKRREIHERIANILLEEFPILTANNPELVALHYTEAGVVDQAIDTWYQAGDKANERSQNQEAIRHLSQGLSLLRNVPSDDRNRLRELAFQTTLGAAQIAVYGAGAKEVELTYQRAQQLQDALGATIAADENFAVLWGQWRVCKNLKLAVGHAEDLLNLAERQGDGDMRLQAHHAKWGTLLFLGELRECYRHIEKGLILYRSERSSTYISKYGGHDTAVCAHCHGALILWLEGNPSEALARAEEAVALARRLRSTPSEAHALDYQCMLLCYLRDFERVEEVCQAILKLCHEHDFKDFQTRAEVMRDWVLTYETPSATILENIRANIELLTASGTTEDLPFSVAC